MIPLRIALLAALFAGPIAASAAHAEPLDAAQREELLAVARSWSAEAATFEWSTGRPGRFVQHDDEWLVSLAGPCIGGCAGLTFIARRTPQGWTKVAGDDRLVTDDCATVRLSDGRDRVACLGSAGPNQAKFTQRPEM